MIKMEKERNSRVIAVIALVVGVLGLSLGFAAFTSTLTISSNAEVKPAGTTFNVDFSSAETSVVTDAIVPTVSGTGASATNAEIDNSGEPTITKLGATFTAPGQSATYEFYAHNAGEFVAYLNSIAFENVQDASTPKVCTPKTGTTDSYVTAACEDINVSVKVGDEAVTYGTQTGITGHTLAKGAGEKIIVTIAYEEKENQTLVDGDFSVSFGNIVLDYSSVD